MRHKYEPQGADINPDAPDEVWEAGEDGKLHLLDIDALMNQSGDCGLLTEDEVEDENT